MLYDRGNFNQRQHDSTSTTREAPTFEGILPYKSSQRRGGIDIRPLKKSSYNSAVGPVRVERSLYRHPSGGRSVCPLELNAGIIEGYWTPLAAKQASWAVAHLTPKESEELFEMLGNMTPSKSTLDRLPKALGAHWEAHRCCGLI